MVSADAQSVLMLHAAAGRNLFCLFEERDQRPKAEQIIWSVRCCRGCKHALFPSCSEQATSIPSPRAKANLDTPPQDEEPEPVTWTKVAPLPFGEAPRFPFMLKRILVAHPSMSAVETRPDSLWHIRDVIAPSVRSASSLHTGALPAWSAEIGHRQNFHVISGK